jgi:hypothetical protein
MQATSLILSLRRSLFGALGALAAMLAIASPTSAAQLKPFDHAAKDKTLVEFRLRLIAAADSRDFLRLEPLLSPGVQLSFGGHTGIAEARKMFRDDPSLWDKLARALRHGGGFETDRETNKTMFIAPYTYFAKAPPGLDPFEYVIVTGENVAVRARPSTVSAPLKRLSYETIPTASGGISDATWQRVKLPDGRIGYVAQRYLATAGDHRAGIQKADGQWKMIFFLAGD